MFSNYRSYYNKEQEQHCMTDHRIENNPLSSFENKQRSFLNISYMVFFTYFTIYGVTTESLFLQRTQEQKPATSIMVSVVYSLWSNLV
jgi:hypothetical protein